jgi:hypothetical protein
MSTKVVSDAIVKENVSVNAIECRLRTAVGENTATEEEDQGKFPYAVPH